MASPRRAFPALTLVLLVFVAVAVVVAAAGAAGDDDLGSRLCLYRKRVGDRPRSRLCLHRACSGQCGPLQRWQMRR